MKVFRAYDIRGVYGVELTDELAFNLGKAFSTLNMDEVIVGWDNRLSSPRLAEAFTKGAVSAGIDVIHLGELPNPIHYFSCWLRKKYGAYITASHNPPEYNGFKLTRGDGTSLVKELEKLKNAVATPVTAVQVGAWGRVEKYGKAIDDYIDFLKEKFCDKLNVKIAVETFGGVTGRVVEKMFKEFDVETVLLRKEVRGDFYGRRPEPTEESLSSRRKKVIELGADFGVGFDGDGDRSVFVDDEGNVLDGSKAGALLVKLTVRKGDKVVVTPDVSSGLVEYLRGLGAEVVWCKIGHGYIEEKVRDEKAVLGIEQSCHFYHGYLYPFSDGLLSALTMCLLAKEGKISEMASELRFNPVLKIYVNVGSDEVKLGIIKAVALEHEEGVWVGDGIRFMDGEAWILVRASQTMPEVNVCIEAPTHKAVEKYRKKYVSLIMKHAKNISRLLEEDRDRFPRAGRHLRRSLQEEMDLRRPS